MNSEGKSPVSVVLLNLFAYGIKYVANIFLTFSVLSTFAATAIIYITIWGSDVQFLQYFSFILPIDSKGNANLGAGDIMRVFSLLALFFLVLSESARALKGILLPSSKASQQVIRKSFFSRWIISFTMISIIFLITALILPFANLSEGTSLIAMYGIILFFYVIATFSSAIYTGINHLAEKVLR